MVMAVIHPTPHHANMPQGNCKIGVTNESRLMCGRKIILSPVDIPYAGTLGTKQSNLVLPNVILPTSRHESCDTGYQITQHKCRSGYPNLSEYGKKMFYSGDNA